MWDFVMDISGAGAGFLRELRFSLPIYIPSASPQSSSPITRGWQNRPGVAAVPIASQSRIKKKKVFPHHHCILAANETPLARIPSI
jgi:hypothetical protein